MNNQALDQIYSLAVVLKAKYAYIRWAIMAIIVGATASFVINGTSLASKGLNPQITSVLLNP